jgi:mannose/fructose/N-acetylgalactosamine-specific phosphotransferase system component IIC
VLNFHAGRRRYLGILLLVLGGALLFGSGFVQQWADDAGDVVDTTVVRIAGAVLVGVGFGVALKVRPKAD